MFFKFFTRFAPFWARRYARMYDIVDIVSRAAGSVFVLLFCEVETMYYVKAFRSDGTPTVNPAREYDTLAEAK